MSESSRGHWDLGRILATDFQSSARWIAVLGIRDTARRTCSNRLKVRHLGASGESIPHLVVGRQGRKEVAGPPRRSVEWQLEHKLAPLDAQTDQDCRPTPKKMHSWTSEVGREVEDVGATANEQ